MSALNLPAASAVSSMSCKTFSSAGLPNNSFAAINPPTITEAEEPSPLEIGICVLIVIFNSLGMDTSSYSSTYSSMMTTAAA